MEFDGFRTNERRKSGRLKPPPNYSSRGVQLKLLLLVGSLVLVFAMMNEARKPETWSFMGFDQNDADQSAEAEEAQIDSRRFLTQEGESSVVDSSPQDDDNDKEPTDSETDPSNRDQSDQSQASTTAESNDGVLQTLNSDVEAGGNLAETLLQRTRQDFWGGIYDRLDDEWRRLLYIGLRGGRCKTPLKDQEAESWNALVDAIAKDRNEYESDILRAITALPLESEAKRVAWTDVLQSMQKTWSEIELALKAVPNRTNDDQAFTLLDLQLLMDDLLLARVKDDYLGSRKQEKEIWYRQFERLMNWAGANEQNQPIAEPYYVNEGSSEAPQIGFVQLFEQPDAYRGRLIKIVGEVKRVEYKRSASNDYDIEGYHVLWIRPEGKANLPMVVYALQLPEEYPDYDEAGQIEFPRGKLQPIELEAVFFKRWAYEAQDGVRLCPLLLAIEPDWKERPDQFEQLSKLPSIPVAAAMIVLVAIVSIGIARYAFNFASKDKVSGFRMPGHAERRMPDSFPDVTGQDDADK